MCPSVQILSPDRAKTLRRVFRWDNNVHQYLPELEVISASGDWDLLVSATWPDVDVLWSPGSDYLSLTGSTSGTTNSTLVYRIADDGPRQLDVMKTPLEDMLRSFPPCKAAHTLLENCETAGEYFNFAVIAWVKPHTAVIMGEVPSSGQWGGIMGQVVGFEVDLPSGQIDRRMTAREFKARWQNSMAWNFRIPDPPEFQK